MLIAPEWEGLEEEKTLVQQVDHRRSSQERLEEKQEEQKEKQKRLEERREERQEEEEGAGRHGGMTRLRGPYLLLYRVS